MRRRTVLYVDHFPDVGGGQASLLTRLDHLGERWRPVVAVAETTGDLHRQLADRGVPFVRVPFNRGDVRSYNEKGIHRRPGALAANAAVVGRATRTLRATIRQEGVDLVHGNSFKGSVLSVAPALSTGTPLIHHAHSSRAYSDHGPLDWYVCTAAARVVANSEFTAGTYDRWADRTEVVYNAVDLDRFDPESVDPGAVRARYDARDRPLIGVVGRLTPRKRQVDLVRALPTLLSSHPDLRALLVGGSYEGLGGDYETRLRETVADLGLEEAVTFAGHVEDVASHLAALDVLVLPSIREPFGRVLAEAQLLETPVVASGTGGVPEVVTHGETGYLVPERQPRAVADAVDRLLADPERAREMGRTGRRRVRERFAADRITRQEEAVYEEVLER